MYTIEKVHDKCENAHNKHEEAYDKPPLHEKNNGTTMNQVGLRQAFPIPENNTSEEKYKIHDSLA